MKQIVLAAAVLLAACAERGEGAYTVSGRYLGNPEQKMVEPEESKLALPNALMPILEVKRATYSDRVKEEAKIERGRLYLSTASSGGFRNRVSDRQFRAMFDAGAEAPLVPERWRRVTYAEHTVGQRPCLFFMRPIGQPQPHAVGGHATHDSSLTGFLCGDSGQSDFKERVLRLIDQIDLK